MGKALALVTGSAARVADVGAALEGAGFSVTTVATGNDLGGVCDELGVGSVNCYVQLPVDIVPSGATALERVHSLLEQGLLARFEAARQVLPALAADSAVVLVSGNLLTAGGGNDDQRARLALLRVLAHSLLADSGDRRTWVTVVDHRHSAEEIAAMALDRGQARLRMIAEFADQNADLSYDDWKLALLSLTSSEI